MSNKEPVFKQTNWATRKAHIFTSSYAFNQKEAIRTGYREVEIKAKDFNPSKVDFTIPCQYHQA